MQILSASVPSANRDFQLRQAATDFKKAGKIAEVNKLALAALAACTCLTTLSAIIFFATVTVTLPMIITSVVVGVVALGVIALISLKLYKPIGQFKRYQQEKNSIAALINKFYSSKDHFLLLHFNENIKSLNDVIFNYSRFSNKVQLNAQIAGLQKKIQDELRDVQSLPLNVIGLTLQQRLDLYSRLIDQSNDSAPILVGKIGLLDLTGTTVDQRLALYEKMIQKCPELAEELAKEGVPGRLDLMGATGDQLLQFYFLIVETKAAAELFALKIEQFDLTILTSDQRFQLYSKAIRNHNHAVIGLMANGDKLGLDKNHRIDLYASFAKQKKLNCWMKYFHKLDMHDFIPEERLEFYKTMVKGYASEGLAENFDKLNLKSHEWLELCKEYLNEEESIQSLISHFDSVCIDDGDLFALVNCIIHKHREKQFVESDDFFAAIRDKNTKRQILIDFLSPLSEWGGSIDVSRFQSFTNEIQVIIDTLNQEPSQIISDERINELRAFINKNPKLSTLAKVIESRVLEINGMELERDQQKSDLMRWAAYTAGMLYELEDSQIALLSRQIGSNGNTVLDFISNNKTYRYHLLRASSLSAKKYFSLSLRMNWKHPATFLLAPLTEFGWNSPDIMTRLQTTIIEVSQIFQDPSLYNALIRCLLTIELNGPYTVQESEDILRYLIDILAKMSGNMASKLANASSASVSAQTMTQMNHVLIKNLAALTNLFQIANKQGLCCARLGTFPSEYFQIATKSSLGIEAIEDAEIRYQETFGRFRDPNAVFACMSKIDCLPLNTITKTKETFSAYINSVLKGNFHQIRYNTANNPDLQKIFAFNLNMESQWRTSYSMPMSHARLGEEEKKEEQSDPLYQRQRLVIEETDDPDKLLMLNDNVPISKFPAFLMDGAVRAILIKERGNPVATAFICLLWDQKNNAPVLLREDVYVTNQNIKVDVIDNVVKEKAKRMGIEIRLK